MAEDRFANVFTADVTLSAPNALTFVEMTFGITLRDRVAIVIDEMYFYVSSATIALMTTTGDEIQWGLSVSDQPTDIQDVSDRRILYTTSMGRMDFGVAAAGSFYVMPLKNSFAPPLIALPNRMFFGVDSVGLPSAINARLRMHFRTVKITQDQQLIEVLEAFQLST